MVNEQPWLPYRELLLFMPESFLPQNARSTEQFQEGLKKAGGTDSGVLYSQGLRNSLRSCSYKATLTETTGPKQNHVYLQTSQCWPPLTCMRCLLLKHSCNAPRARMQSAACISQHFSPASQGGAATGNVNEE